MHDVEQRIRAALPGQAPALADEIALSARLPYRLAVGLLAEPAAADNAAYLLNRAGELALTPLLAAEGLGTRDVAWAIQVVVDTDNALRRDMLRWLAPLLDDETPVAPGDKPAKRVCDAAYLAVLGLVRFADSEVDPRLDEPAFLAMSTRRRDAHISGLKLTWTYRRAHGEETP